VADHHQGAGVALEPGFKPDQGVQIQVVGGFVEQQEVGRAHQGPGQLQAHAPAAGETVHRLGEFIDVEAETQDQGLGPGCRVVGAGIVEGGVGMGHAHAVVAGFGGGHLLLGGQQHGVALDDEVGGALLGLRHVLGHLGHAPLGGNVEVAAVLVQVAVEQGEEGGLAGAVAPHQADLFAGVDGDGSAVQHHLGTAAQDDVLEGNHGESQPEGRP